jgi:uncharacterized membrane protein YoaK (UPF0700 family)
MTAATIAEDWLPAMLSVIAGMVDVTGFLALGNIFTAHITGNLVVASARLVRGGPVNAAQLLAIPVFIVAVGGVWWFARRAPNRGLSLRRRLMILQCALIGACLAFSAVTHPSADPRGFSAGIAVMIAVSAMACQFTLLRLTLPTAPSTAVMTGNLTSTVLSLLDALSAAPQDAQRASQHLTRSLRALIGFLVGCILGALGVSFLHDWAWVLPFGLAAAAVALS